MLGEIDVAPEALCRSDRRDQSRSALEPKATKLYAQLADAYTGAGNAKAAADARAKVGDGMPALGDPIGLGLVQATAPTPAPSRTDPAPAEALTPASAAALRSLTPAREASFLLATRQYDAARQKLEGAMRTRPNDAELLGIYARVEAADGNLPQARQRATAAVDRKSERCLRAVRVRLVLEMATTIAARRARTKKRSSLDRRSRPTRRSSWAIS